MRLSKLLGEYKLGLSGAFKHTLLGVAAATALYGAVVDKEYSVALTADRPNSKSAARDIIGLRQRASRLVNQKENGTSRLSLINYGRHPAGRALETSGGSAWPLAAPEWYVDDSVAESGDGASWETAFKTIQEGIDAATDGQTIVAAQGYYVENIHYDGKNIRITSTDPLDPGVVANTVIDGNESGPVISFSGTEDQTCVLSGFTIQNGKDTVGGGICGGYWSGHTLASVTNNLIAGNSAEYAGGGLARCDGTIRDNIVRNNAASLGGGLFECAGVIVGNQVAYNTALSGDGYSPRGGGGLARCAGLIEGNTISGNAASVGGGLYHCDNVVRNNVVTENLALAEGGGLADCDGPIENNTISGNLGSGLSECDGVVQYNLILGNLSGKSEGGGLARCDGTIQNNVIAGNVPGLEFCGGTIRNNTIVGNRGHFGSDGSALLACTAAITNCIIWGNEDVQIQDSSEPTYSCIEGSSEGGQGNIAEDPKFVDPDGPDDNRETYEDNDYRLRADSPCIDAGFNDPGLPETDIVGMHRIMFGGKSLTVDMGAYEFYVNRIEPIPGRAVLTWSSLEAKTYSIFYTEDLFTWHLAIDNFPSFGNTTTSWLDDGTLTGIPPCLVPKRFYRLLEKPSR